LKRKVIDASVAAKWAFPEEESEAASLLLHAMVAGEIELLAPDSFVSEIGNIAWKKAALRHEISLEEGRQGLKLLLAVLPRLLPGPPLMVAALEIALAYRRSVYDCLYVALALEADCDFVTADESLVKALSGAFPCVVGLSAAG
jgi:predicted nucleic acid-binding protein